MDASRAKLYLISMICFLCLVILMVFSGNQSANTIDDEKMLAIENSRIQVMPVTIQQEYIRERVVYGQVEAGQLTDIGFDRSGLINQLLVEDGAFVVAGQALATLDMSRINAQKSELKAALKRARAEAHLAKLNKSRIDDLVKSKLEPEQRLDEAQAQLDANNALVSQVQAQLESLEVEVTKSTLEAPYDGQIIAQYLDAGTVVNPGDAVFQIIDSAKLEARFGLPEETAFQLQDAVSFRLNHYGTEIKAILKSIDRSRSQATRTLDAVFSIPLDQKQISNMVTGDIISLTVELPYQQRGSWLPLSALANGVRGLWTVLVLNQETSQLESRLVIAEHIERDDVFVSGALSPNDLVVVDGLQRFTPGQKVTDIVTLSPTDVVAKR